MPEIERLRDLVNGDEWLTYRGRYLNATLLLEVGADAYLIRIHNGEIESVSRGPFVMPRWTFALRASMEAWEKFCQPRPEPGYHDVLAMVKFKTLKLDGDQHPFMSNLLYFKDVLACLRGATR